MPDQPGPSPKHIDWHDVRQKTVTALVIAGVLGAGGLAWNGLSQGGLIRLLGGVTKEELLSSMKQQAILPRGAIVAFDVACPPGWGLADEAVGNAIVGVGATAAGETGSPLPSGYEPSAKLDPRWETLSKPQDFIRSSPDGEPISRYVFGVRTSVAPSYLPLYYCKKL